MRIKTFIVFMLVLSASNAHATLGQSTDSIEADRAALSGVLHAPQNHAAYTVQEFQTDATTIREYVSLHGTVFGIAWSGLAHPNLDPLLGSYADDYKKAEKNSPHKKEHRRYRAVKSNRVVVERWGHMRKLQGRAYDPSLLPTGVNASELL